MRHRATRGFWQCYQQLPVSVRRLADKNFELLKADSSHPSLQFKRLGKYWAARVGAHYRALAAEGSDGFVWFWIGSHAEYDRMIQRT